MKCGILIMKYRVMLGRVVKQQVSDKYTIYMDVCCLNRPFDDQTQDRIYLEAEAVLSILSHCKNKEWTLVSSNVIDFELSRMTNEEKAEKVRALYSAARKRVMLTPQAIERAEFFQKQGLQLFDSLHLATAESSKLSVFLTTDDKLLRKALSFELTIPVANPVTWMMEVLK